MFVRQIMEFINSVNTVKPLSKFDSDFLIKFQIKFSSLKANQQLSRDEIVWIKQIFCERWNFIFDKRDDYTRNPRRGSNSSWIALANLLSIETCLTPLQILIPIETLNHNVIAPHGEDLEFLFINEDSTQLISILSLLEDTQNSPALCSQNLTRKRLEHKRAVSTDMLLAMCKEHTPEHDIIKNRNASALSFRELSRIKLKSGHFHLNDHRSSNLWSYLENKVRVIGATGVLPRHLLPALLQLIDMFFSNDCQSDKLVLFQHQLLIWAKLLNNCPIEDVYCLYGQSIQVNNNEVYFLNALLECLHQDSASIQNILIGIARWLNNVDASFICNRKELDKLYTELKVGSKFQIAELKEHLLSLQLECSANVGQKITSLLGSIDGKAEFDVVMIDALSTIYKERWHEIQGSENDYRSMKTGANMSWIRLAQLLARHLEVNYYSFIMPTLRPIHLAELALIKKNKGKLYFDFGGITYENFSYDLGYNLAHGCEAFGELPRHLLPPLLEIIDAYFNYPDGIERSSLLREQLLAWTNRLLECPIDDVHLLYKQPITVLNQQTYFCNILIDCLHENEFDLEHEMIGIAHWLSDYDASFIGKSARLAILYNELHVGFGFGINQLNAILSTLSVECSPVVLSHLNALSDLIRDKEEIDAIVIEALLKVYQQRWTEIQGHKDDYTRQKLSVNSPWIRLAQLVSGAKLVEMDYYHILMPTLNKEIKEDSVTFEPLVYYPLNHFIFSGTSFENLILLDNCVDHYTAMKKHDEHREEKCDDTNFLYNCNSLPLSPLNGEEHELLQYAHKRFRRYMFLTNCLNEENNPITLETVNALTRLVNESLFPQGLAAGVDRYSATQTDLAERAYLNFYFFYKQMADDERNRLNQQLIYFRGMHKSFKKVLSAVKNDGLEACVAKAGQWILQLIIEYVPQRRFSSEIENGVVVEFSNRPELATVGIDKMRSDSRKKIFRDIEQFGEYAQRLCVSIMTHTFESLWVDAYTISLLGCNNRVNGIAKCIFEKLVVMLESGDFTQYPDLIHSITLANPDMLTNCWSEKTKRWLQSIVDGSFYKHTIGLHEPELLLKILFPFLKMEMQATLESFFDDVLQTYTQEPQNIIMNKIRINIKFLKLVGSLSPECRRVILNSLSAECNQHNDVNLRTMSIKYLVHRMVAFGMAGSSTRQLQFLAANEFNIELVSHVVENDHSVRQIVERLIGMVGATASNPLVKDRAVGYLNKIVASFIEPQTSWALINLG